MIETAAGNCREGDWQEASPKGVLRIEASSTQPTGDRGWGSIADRLSFYCMGDSGPAACTAELRLQLSAALQLQDSRRGGGPGTSSGRVWRGLHCRSAKGYLLELESGLDRLNAADLANLETVRAKVAGMPIKKRLFSNQKISNQKNSFPINKNLFYNQKNFPFAR